MRLIDADALIDRLPEAKPDNPRVAFNGALADMLIMIDNAPTIDAQPVEHGYWIPYYMPVEELKEAFESTRYCSCCGMLQSIQDDYRYCPYCGAKMDGDANATD